MSLSTPKALTTFVNRSRGPICSILDGVTISVDECQNFPKSNLSSSKVECDDENALLISSSPALRER